MPASRNSFTIDSIEQVVNGQYSVWGRGSRTVRLAHKSIKDDTGFCTTTYSYSMSPEMMEYSANRISLAMRLLSGMSNEDIKQLIAKREQDNK